MDRTVVILGRPNVGKSTLFNRLVGARRALVSGEAGVTRDRLEGTAELFGLRFRVIDTAGLDLAAGEELAARVRAQTLQALSGADVALFLIDARTGITPLDEEIAALLRRQDKPVVLVANKCEGRAAEAQALEAHALGLGPPVLLSAEHGLGFEDLAEALRPHLGMPQIEREEAAAEGGEERPIHVAVVGRPNTGKSSLVNRLLGEERMVVAPVPGVTRDAVDVGFSWRAHRFLLVDTAGLRRKARVEPGLERLATGRTIRAIRRADVVLLVVDATAPLEKQDVSIAALAADSGKPVVIALNKWDLVVEPQRTLALVRARIAHRLSQLRGVPVVPCSARTGRNLDRLLEQILEVHERWSRRVPTGPLNRWLREVTSRHPPPMVAGRRPKLRYATQTGTRPPTIILFGNRPAENLPASYLRYLLQDFRSRFGLEGIPVRIEIRSGDNPYLP